MRMTFTCWFILIFIAAFFVVYLLFRSARSNLIRTGLTCRLQTDDLPESLIQGDRLPLTAVVENRTRRTVSLLKLEPKLPNGLTIDTRNGRISVPSEAAICTIPPHGRAELTFHVSAEEVGSYPLRDISILAIGYDLLGMGNTSLALPVSDDERRALTVTARDTATPLPRHRENTADAEAVTGEAHALRQSIRRSMRSAKAVAYLGIAAMILPYFDIFSRWVTRNYASVAALLLVPFMMAAGYAVQYLLLGSARREMREATPGFSYELGRIKITPWRVVTACILTAGFGFVVGRLVGGFFVDLLQNDLFPPNEEVGIPFLIGACMAVGVVGCLLLPFQFHQLLSVRTAIELITPFLFLLIFQTLWTDGANRLFAPSILIYAFCLMICMNRESILRAVCEFPGTTRDQCRTLSRIGLKDTTIAWLCTLGMALPLAALCSVIQAGLAFLLLFGIGGAVVAGIMWQKFRKKQS